MKLPNYAVSANSTKNIPCRVEEEHQMASNVFEELQRASSSFEAAVILLPCSNRPVITGCIFHLLIIMNGLLAKLLPYGQ